MKSTVLLLIVTFGLASTPLRGAIGIGPGLSGNPPFVRPHADCPGLEEMVAPPTARATTSSFAPVGSMSVTRFFHTATLLGNSRVLIAGGVTTTGPTKTAELFDAATGQFTVLLTKMTSERYEHTATMLPSGRVLISGGVTANGVTSTAEIFDPVTGTFTALSHGMISARANHTATLMPNGKVFIAGGFNGSVYTDTAEIFDPATQTFTPASSNKMIGPRSEHTANLLPNGSILLAGGFDGSNYLDTGEIFDPSAGTFTATPTMSSVRAHHSATLLPTGKVLLAGGYIGAASATTSSAELFDPVSKTFSFLPPMNAPRQFHSATILATGKILLAGGSDGVLPVNTADVFDPIMSTFTPVAPMTMARNVHTATLLADGRVLLAGGNTVALPQNTNTAELFDPSSPEFIPLLPTTMIIARYQHSATPLPNGKILIAGGRTGLGPPTSSPATDQAELYDPAAKTFTLLPSMNSRRYNHTATLLPDGKVFIAGGDTGSNYSDTAEIFDSTTKTFTLVSNRMHSARLQHSATLLANGTVLLAGGVTQVGSYTDTAELFDPATETFTFLTGMNSKRWLHSATLLSAGKVLIAGGFNGTDALRTAEMFDPVTRIFIPVVANMGLPRITHTATLLPNGKVLIAAGSTAVQGTNTAELFDPVAQTFTLLGPLMNAGRFQHTATLLPNGQVLIAGGSANVIVSAGTVTFNGLADSLNNSAEVFDPAPGIFHVIPPMTTARLYHTATLLPDGQVLIAGGDTGNNGRPTNLAELFDNGTAVAESRRPVISTVVDPLLQPGALALTGTRFRGDSEGSFGSMQSSATNYPILRLQRVDNEQVYFPHSDPAFNWSDSIFISETLGADTRLPEGQYRLSLLANAVSSAERMIRIGAVLQPTRIVSRKPHGSAGTFDVDLPLTGNPGIECRSGGPNGDYQVIVSFPTPVTFTSASLSEGTGTVDSTSTSGNQVIANLTGVTNGQRITLSLSGVNDGTRSGAVSIPMAILIGDTNADGFVNSADISQTKSFSGQPVANSDFRTDLTVDGSINSADISLVKSRSGTALP